MKIPVINDMDVSIPKIFEVFKPEYFNVSNSLLFKSFIKNNCDVIKKIKGNISNIIEGEFINAKDKVK